MKTQYKKWISKKLRELREDSGLSQSELAAKLELKKQTYKAYEEQRCLPSVIIIKQLCTLYHITVDKFLQDSPLVEAG